MSKPDDENHLTLRQNGQLSDIACLVCKDTFMQYKFRGNYAEDLDLGIRLIKDGYKLALLRSTRIIHSHNRPAYYYLKRGYVDTLSLSRILVARPGVALEAERLCRDIVFIYGVVHALVCQELQQVPMPCPTGELVRIVRRKFRAAATGGYPMIIDMAHHGYIDNKFGAFLENLYNCYYRKSTNKLPYDGMLLDAIQSYISMILVYMDDIYELIDQTILEEFKVCLYKACAFQSGSSLASCFFMGSENTKKKLKEINNELIREI